MLDTRPLEWWNMAWAYGAADLLSLHGPLLAHPPLLCHPEGVLLLLFLRHALTHAHLAFTTCCDKQTSPINNPTDHALTSVVRVTPPLGTHEVSG